jgi:hypothetical protein
MKKPKPTPVRTYGTYGTVTLQELFSYSPLSVINKIKVIKRTSTVKRGNIEQVIDFKVILKILRDVL